jgi:nucleotide-binding universal stress UspA family protein
MAKRILVPLDGSRAAERVVPLVTDVARGSGASLRLLHVASAPDSMMTRGVHLAAHAEQEMARLERDGRDYLHILEARLQGVPVDSVVRFGDPVAEILKEADAFGADLIAVTTAGQSGLCRVALGSVAEQVFLRAATNVVLFHASPHGTE